MSVVLLRFSDLRKRNIVRNWVQLRRLQQNYHFPSGKMLSPNTRVWLEEEIDAWVAGRPSENLRPLQGEPKRRHERRLAAMRASAIAAEPAPAASPPPRRRKRAAAPGSEPAR